jgi:hypothetical protein
LVFLVIISCLDCVQFDGAVTAWNGQRSVSTTR